MVPLPGFLIYEYHITFNVHISFHVVFSDSFSALDIGSSIKLWLITPKEVIR